MYQESATKDKTRTSVGCISSDCTKTSTISPVLFLAMCNIFFGNHYERSGPPLFQAQAISEKMHYLKVCTLKVCTITEIGNSYTVITQIP